MRDGELYILNGQKIWISTAHIAKWGLFLVRTDPTAIREGRKHEGITALIVDMEAPGIECRPIREITGDAQVSVVEPESWAAAFGALEAAGLPAALVGRTLRVPGAAPDAVRAALGGLTASVTSAPATLEERFFQLTLSARNTKGQA